MATPKKVSTKAPLPMTDKRSKAYRNSQKKKAMKLYVSHIDKEQVCAEKSYSEAVLNVLANSEIDIPWTGIETATVQETPWAITNIIHDIRNKLELIRYNNKRLTDVVNAVVYIERKVDDKDKFTKRSDTVTDNLDDIRWQLKEISETYYNELEILERYIGNTNKA